MFQCHVSPSNVMLMFYMKVCKWPSDIKNNAKMPEWCASLCITFMRYSSPAVPNFSDDPACTRSGSTQHFLIDLKHRRTRNPTGNCMRGKYDHSWIRNWQSRSAQMWANLHPSCLVLRPPSSSPPLLPGRHFKYGGESSSVSISYTQSYSYLDGERQSRQYWQQEYRTVHIHGRVPKRSTSWWINILSCSGFFCRDVQPRVPLSSMLGFALWECATAHTAAPVKVSWPHVWREESVEEKGREADWRWSVRKPQNLTDTSKHWDDWTAKQTQSQSMLESWISTITSFWRNNEVIYLGYYLNRHVVAYQIKMILFSLCSLNHYKMRSKKKLGRTLKSVKMTMDGAKSNNTYDCWKLWNVISQ